MCLESATLKGISNSLSDRLRALGHTPHDYAMKVWTYHVSCEPLRIFWKDDTTCSTWVPCVLPTTGWIHGFWPCSGQHAWHSCRGGCIVISENPQGLATHMVQGNAIFKIITTPIREGKIIIFAIAPSRHCRRRNFLLSLMKFGSKGVQRPPQNILNKIYIYELQ